MYMYSITFGLLEVREIEISLRKLSGDTAQFRTSEGTLITVICTKTTND